MSEPPAKRQHLKDDVDEVDAAADENALVNGGGVGGIKDILAYHSGNLPRMTIRIENIHQINMGPLDDWNFYVLPLAHA